MSWKIVNMLAPIGRFTVIRPLISRGRDWITPRQRTRPVPADVRDGRGSIFGPLFEDERVELERLFKEIDQFSATFNTGARE